MTRMLSTSALRLVAAGALGLPLTLGVTGVANAETGHAHEHGHDCGHPGGGQRAVQGGDVVGALAQVNPALNVGGILNSGPVTQTAYAASPANTGIQQSGGHGHGGQRAAQGGNLVGALAQVNPALNVGGILNSGPVTQTAYAASPANTGIQQSGGHGHGPSGGQESFQAGDLVEALVQVNPAVNVGGIANSGPVTQTAHSDSAANSGIQQSGGHGGGSKRAAQGGGLLGLNLQVNPTVNIGGILSSGGVSQNAVAASGANSGI
ncbi:hypothetical protein [Pseudonocardia pini]|uniref:hypothetical protein n=1 Tax=Pseudonocardia pini TaxID=2758030 RepID=UPI0015F07EB3|nr:hypothetical protein [Pseudonocardia pini]